MHEKMKSEYAESSNSKLLALHQGISRACESDRSMTIAMQHAAQVFGSPLNYHGVDEFPDWRIQGEALEAELTVRGIAFVPLVF